jgi:hypothetical protein
VNEAEHHSARSTEQPDQGRERDPRQQHVLGPGEAPRPQQTADDGDRDVEPAIGAKARRAE